LHFGRIQVLNLLNITHPNMPRGASKRVLSNIDELTSVPPSPPLPSSRTIARVSQAQGKNLFHCVLPHGDTILAELAPIFRGKAWMRRGGYVVVDTAVFEGRSNKIGGEIVNVVRNEKDWRKMNYWYEKLLWEAKPSIDPV
jgi:probable RNA-binding protein EIF1AD